MGMPECLLCAFVVFFAYLWQCRESEKERKAQGRKTIIPEEKKTMHERVMEAERRAEKDFRRARPRGAQRVMLWSLAP